MSKSTEDRLAELHSKVAEKLISKINSDEVTVADLAIAIKFLKDNAIVADINSSKVLSELEEKINAHTLPFPTTRSN
jgi:translation elongation factor EF-1beta